MTDSEGRYYGGPFSGLKTAGLDHANVSDKRINPEIAYITRAPKSLADLAQLDPDAINKTLVGFVPYSVIKDEHSPYVLILPMGLQKTAGGFGSMKEWVHPYPTDRKNFGKISDRRNEVKAVLPKLAGAIIEKYKHVIFLTRFADPNWDGPGTAWNNGGLRQWERLFPGRFRLGWTSFSRRKSTKIQNPLTRGPLDAEYDALEATQKKLPKESQQWKTLDDRLWALSDKIDDIPEDFDKVTIVTGEPEKPLGPPDVQPKTYAPGRGGAKIADDLLTITDAAGAKLFSVGDISLKFPINTLADPRTNATLGTLLCGWTKPPLDRDEIQAPFIDAAVLTEQRGVYCI